MKKEFTKRITMAGILSAICIVMTVTPLGSSQAHSCNHLYIPVIIAGGLLEDTG